MPCFQSCSRPHPVPTMRETRWTERTVTCSGAAPGGLKEIVASCSSRVPGAYRGLYAGPPSSCGRVLATSGQGADCLLHDPVPVRVLLHDGQDREVVELHRRVDPARPCLRGS